MKISKLALIALLGGALMAFGCSSDDNGSGGTPGTGGTGGVGGDPGTGGVGGDPGTGGTGGVVACAPAATQCSNGDIGPTEPCCTLPAPPDASVCNGDESTEAPASCTATDTVVTHTLTVFEILGDCNQGFDLDSCDGVICAAGGLAPGEGVDGVDNALAGLAPVLEGVGGNLDGVNQAFSDLLCGEDSNNECAEATPLVLELAVDANLEENCANVDVIVNGESAGTTILNVSDPTDGAVCASGTLPNIPLNIGGTEGALANVTLVTTIVPDTGFSDGVMGATVDADTAVAIAEALLPGAGAVVGQVFDITDDLQPGGNCDALSGTYSVGGVVLSALPQ